MRAVGRPVAAVLVLVSRVVEDGFRVEAGTTVGFREVVGGLDETGGGLRVDTGGLDETGGGNLVDTGGGLEEMEIGLMVGGPGLVDVEGGLTVMGPTLVETEGRTVGIGIFDVERVDDLRVVERTELEGRLMGVDVGLEELVGALVGGLAVLVLRLVVVLTVLVARLVDEGGCDGGFGHKRWRLCP